MLKKNFFEEKFNFLKKEFLLHMKSFNPDSIFEENTIVKTKLTKRILTLKIKGS